MRWAEWFWIRLLFGTFQSTGSAMATVREFRSTGVLFPRRIHSGPGKGDVIWGKLEHSQVLRVLHNPRYAGVFVYGRTRTRKGMDGECRVQHLSREEWHTFLPESHPAYISWQEYERNLRRLRESAQALGLERRKSPPREGPALLQGLIVCGKCGRRMTLRYHARQAGLCPEYVCQRKGIENAEPPCQRIPGAEVDRVLSDMLLELMNPITLEVALSVQQELQARLDESDRLRKQHVERARYEAELAQRRYMHVDPENRLVADTLEADWNQKLRTLAEAQEQYEQRREQDRWVFNEEQRAAIMALAQDFPRLWRDPATEDRDRKRMIRLLVEDVTMLRGEQITLHVRFRGGAARTVVLPNPLRSWESWMTDAEVVGKIDQLLNTQTFSEIAATLNRDGFRSGKGQRFTLYRPHSKTVRASLAVRPAARARPADAQPNGKRPERPSANCKGLDRSWTTQGSCLHRQARAPIRAGWPWHAQESTGRETITSPTSRFGPAAVFERGAV